MIDQAKNLTILNGIPHAKVTDEKYRVRIALGELAVDLYEGDTESQREAKVKKFVEWVRRMNEAAITHPLGHIEPKGQM